MGVGKMYNLRMDEFSVGDAVVICMGAGGIPGKFLCFGTVMSVSDKNVVVNPNADWMKKEITFTYRKSKNFVAMGYGYHRHGPGPYIEPIPF